MEKMIKFRNAVRILAITSFMVVGVSFGAGIAKADTYISGGNGTTGPGSLNTNDWNINHDVSVDINNHSTALNNQCFVVDSSIPSVDHNTLVGDLSSGNIFGDVSIANSLNNGTISLMNPDMGNVSVNVSNDLTGPGSMNQNTVDLSMNHTVNVTNSADINNTLGFNATSGGGNISNNTEVGNYHGGSISLDANINNSANHNTGILNLGDLGGGNVGVSAINHLTGPQSTNTNDVTVDNNSTVNVNNTSDISNNVNLSANSGGGTIGNNTVVGDYSTGNIHFGVSVTNQAN